MVGFGVSVSFNKTFFNIDDMEYDFYIEIGITNPLSVLPIIVCE
jgi:hypothetical protein